MIQEIAAKVREATRNGKKIAMFHYQVLIDAEELNGVKPEEFCEEIGVKESYKTEFTKMLNLAKLMKEEGTNISKA